MPCQKYFERNLYWCVTFTYFESYGCLGNLTPWVFDMDGFNQIGQLCPSTKWGWHDTLWPISPHS